MAQVFKTAKDSPHDVEILGAGTAFAHGKGGVPVEQASRRMTELNEKNDDGTLKLDDDGNPIPLTGSKLTAAAKKFAESRGLVVENVSEEKLADLPREAGAPADRPPAAEVSKQRYEEIYGHLVHHNSPEEMTSENPVIATGQSEGKGDQ